VDWFQLQPHTSQRIYRTHGIDICKMKSVDQMLDSKSPQTHVKMTTVIIIIIIIIINMGERSPLHLQHHWRAQTILRST